MTAPEPSPYGPWDGFHDAAAALDRAHELDAQRLAEDVTDALERRPSDEAKLYRALARAEAGTLTPAPQFRSARDAGGQYAAACGPLDDLGHCGARYHAATCSSVAEGRLSRGSVAEAEAWNRGLSGHGGASSAAEDLGLSSPSGPDPGSGDTWADLLSAPGGLFSEPEIRARIMAALDGEAADAEPGYAALPEARPPVTGLRTALGL
jgi:hypothetical protein